MSEKLESEKKKELEKLKSAYQNTPDLFERKSFIEGPELLDAVGIHIPNQSSFPLGYTKLWPQDFIVEEITKTGEETTVFQDATPALEVPEAPTVYATLVKAGLSTFEAVSDLAQQLGLPLEKIQYAGIKDKDALTSQKISFRTFNIDSIVQYRSPYCFLKDIAQGKGAIEKGGLQGNRFSILVRIPEVYNQDAFDQQVRHVEKEGFWNFFYLQRFGTPRLINYYWGYLILRGEYEKTIIHFLTEGTEGELPYVRKIRESLKAHHHDWEKIYSAIESLPIMFRNELKIVNHLRSNPTDFAGALATIPEQITLWVYAFSSWLFNNRISSYLKNNITVPDTLPFIMSRNQDDWAIYKDFLSNMDIFPPPFENLKPFPAIQLRGSRVHTKEKVTVHNIQHIPEGVVLSFSLSKGSYATTFLAHLFRLVSVMPPQGIKENMIDIKHVLGEGSLTKTFESFGDILRPKTKNIFEESAED